MTPTQYPDLFWALRGSGNNFGLVVNFTLRTIPFPGAELWGGSRTYTDESFPAVIDAFASLVADSTSDPKAGTWTSWLVYEGRSLAITELWYTEPNGHNAAIFDKSNKIPSLADTTQNRTLEEYTQHIGSNAYDSFRQVYYCLTTKASLEVAEAAKEIFFEEIGPVLKLEGAVPIMVWQPITIGKLAAHPQLIGCRSLTLRAPI